MSVHYILTDYIDGISEAEYDKLEDGSFSAGSFPAKPCSLGSTLKDRGNFAYLEKVLLVSSWT